MKKIKIGILGSGGIAQGANIPAFKKLSDKVEILAIGDINFEKAKSVAQKFDIPKFFNNPESVIEIDEINAISVCVPNKFHAPLTISALNAGKDVLCEKPMSTNVKSAEEMVKAAKKNKKTLMIGMHHRFRGEVIHLKSLINEGKFGKIYYVKVGWLRRRGVPWWGDWFYNKKLSGGGALIDLGVHMIDLGWYLLGCPPPVSAYGSTYSIIGKKEAKRLKKKFNIDDLACGMIKFKNGANLFFDVSWCLNTKQESGYLNLFGSKCGASLEPYEIYTEFGSVMADVIPKYQKTNAHELEIKHFVECLLNNEKTISPGEQGVQVMKMLDAISKSAEMGNSVLL